MTKQMLGVAVVLVFFTPAAWADSEFQEGCARAATEVLCGGHEDCVISAIADKSSNGNESDKAGYAECTKLAKAAKSKGMTQESKKAVARMQAGLAKLNKDIAKEFPFIKVTADFKRLELEDIVRTLKGQSRRSVMEGLSPSNDSTTFEWNYLNPIKTALFNVGKDDLGMEFLKAKIKEIRFSLHTHGGTAFSQRTKVVDKVLLVPGIYTLDQTGQAAGVQEFIEKHL